LGDLGFSGAQKARHTHTECDLSWFIYSTHDG
jgi:hypothetical protein